MSLYSDVRDRLAEHDDGEAQVLISALDLIAHDIVTGKTGYDEMLNCATYCLAYLKQEQVKHDSKLRF